MMRICKLRIFNRFLFLKPFFYLILTILITLLSQISVAQIELVVGDVVITDMKAMRSLLGLSYELDMVDAISIGDIERVNYLIESDEADVDARYHGGNTALMWAAWVGNLDIVRLLVEAGAKLNLQNRVGYTALIQAVWMERLDVVEFLVRLEATDNEFIDLQDCNGRTALMWAAWLGHLGIVRTLVNAGASMIVQDDNGATAVVYAASENHTFIANYLIRVGAEVGVGGLRGWACREVSSWWCY